MKFVIFFLLLPVAAFSQNKFRGGIKAGLNYSDLDFGPDDEFRTGYHVGAFAFFVPSRSFQVGGEIFYSNQGATMLNSPDGKFDLVYTYLYDALLIKAFAIPNHLYLQGGLQTGLPLKKTGESTSSRSDNRIDVAFLAGLGYQANKLDFSFRYNHSLADVHHRMFQFSVGYALF